MSDTDEMDMAALFHAYEAADDLHPNDVIPIAWVPAHIGVRMIEAFSVLIASVGRVGPRSHSNAWPDMMQEFHELVDAQTRAQMEADRRAALERKRERPSAEAHSRADEALAWPLRYLRAFPLQADAIQLWAFCRATGREIEPILADRNKRAKALAADLSSKENTRRDLARSEVLRSNAAWANERLAGVSDPQRIAAIKRNAEIRCQREIDDRDLRAVTLRPHEAMPGKILGRTYLDKQRKIAMMTICEALTRDEVVVR